MNGSTKGTVGFNPEQVRSLLEEIRRAYEFESSNMDALFFGFQNAMLGIDYGDLTGISTSGWYSPEAKRFCEGILTQSEMSASKKVWEVYVTEYNAVVDAANKWNATTGSNVTYPEWPFDRGYGDIITVPDNKNGNIVIDPKIAEHIRVLYNKCKNGFNSMFESQYNKIKQGSAFLGANQYEQLLSSLKNAHNLVVEKADAVYAEASKEIIAAVNKYQAIAKQVSSSFSVNSSTIGSTSNSFNTTN